MLLLLQIKSSVTQSTKELSVNIRDFNKYIYTKEKRIGSHRQQLEILSQA
jgi:hypothetical protein